MKAFGRWREFWQTVPARFYGSYVPSNDLYATYLSTAAKTVSDAEVAKLAGKPRTDPVDFTKLPIG